MHKMKVTKLGWRKLHLISQKRLRWGMDSNGFGILKGEWHIPSKY